MQNHLTRRQFLQASLSAGVAASLAGCAATTPHRSLPMKSHHPHIVFIFADDLGWGDPRCYNPESAIPTPRIDRLAAQGRRFTDAHTAGAVCTPSRYGLLTGRHYWRLGLDRPGLDGYSANIIEPERVTVASLLRQRGYHTACIGKWHLGMGTTEPADYAKPLEPNPTTFGFDYYFGIPASLDMAPYLYIENDRAVVPPTGHIEGTPHGTAEFYRGGPIAEGFDHKEVFPTLTRKAVEIIDNHAAADQPLFLYFAMNAPHTPWLPVAEAQGKSAAGKYGDFVWQVDDSVGAVLEALERRGMADDTLVIFASDNGGLQSWIPEEFDHRTNGPWRGQKGDAWEGGHRVPLIARWPGRIAPGSQNDALLCMTDMLATFAALTGAPLPAEDPGTGLRIGQDSINALPALLEGTATGRDTLVIRSVRGLDTVRQGSWKLITGLGSGGLRWTADEHQPAPGEPTGQLYDLAADPAEARNLWDTHPDKRDHLLRLLEETRAGRPG
jgi:arylsulfatase A